VELPHHDGGMIHEGMRDVWNILGGGV